MSLESPVAELQNMIQSRPQPTGSALPPKWTDALILRFGTIYGAKFTSTISTDDKASDWKSAWAVGLAGLSGDQIKAGLSACAIESAWPPSIAEFRNLCCPPPDYEHEFIQAAHGRWEDNRLRYWTAQGFGYFELRNQPWAQAKARWIKTWHGFMEDEPLPPIPEHVVNAPRLEAPKGPSAIQQECMAKIREILANPAKPSKDWAHRIRNNPAKYPRNSLDMATAALAESDE